MKGLCRDFSTTRFKFSDIAIIRCGFRFCSHPADNLNSQARNHGSFYFNDWSLATFGFDIQGCRALYECYQQVKDAPLKARKLHDEMQTLLEFVNQLRRSLCDRLGRISHVRHIK